MFFKQSNFFLKSYIFVVFSCKILDYCKNILFLAINLMSTFIKKKSLTGVFPHIPIQGVYFHQY